METVFGIGMDLIEIDRVVKACKNPSFLDKYYSKKEQRLFEKRPCRAATNFAGKEAVVKAFGTGFCPIQPSEVEILRKESGAPYVVFSGNALTFVKEHHIIKVHISLSDTKTEAAAYAVAIAETKTTI